MLKEPNWLTPENMKAYIEHLDAIDEYIEMQIQMLQLKLYSLVIPYDWFQLNSSF